MLLRLISILAASKPSLEIDMTAHTDFSLRRHFINTPQARHAFDRLGEIHQDALRAKTSRGLMVLGPSGSGKTTALKQYVNTAFPTLWEPGKFRRALRVEIPSSPSKKSLAMAILQAFDDPLATTSSHSAEKKVARVVTLLKNLHTEVLILDEAQHLVDYKRNTTYEAADWIKSLMNESEVTVVLVGLKRTQKLLWANEQLRRRFCAIVDFERFCLETQEGKQEFAMLIHSIRNILPVPCVTFTTDDMLRRLHLSSFGLIDYLIKVLDRSVWMVQSGRVPGIDQSVLAAAFRDEVWDEAPVERNPFAEEFNFSPLIGMHEPFENFNGTSV